LQPEAWDLKPKALDVPGRDVVRC